MLLDNTIFRAYFIDMPWDVVRRGNKWVVVGRDGKVHGTFDSKKKAREQQKAIYANAGNKHGK